MVLARFLPRDERFFDHFRAAATNAAEVAQVLTEVVELGDGVERKIRRLRDLEHHGDEITHEVFNSLNRTFVTPLDREDIRGLVNGLDDFVDNAEEAGRRLWLYRFTTTTAPTRMLARIVHDQAGRLAQAVPLLEHATKQAEAIQRHVVEIHRLENEADDTLTQALAALYDDAKDIPSLISAIRWGEVYGLLEDATDRAEDVANTLEGIVLKYA